MRSLKLSSLLPFLFIFLMGCASSGKLLQKGNYDAAIDKSVKKLMKKPDNTKEIKVLKKAWSLANNDDLDRINKLKLLGQPDIWKDIFRAYTSLDNRQKKVLRLPDRVLSKINFEKEDYSLKMTSALKKAAAYYYAHATKLLKTGNKADARQAYDELQFIKNHLPDYKNLDAKINDALALGVNNILFVLANQSQTVLPKNYEEQILKISLTKLNNRWLNFDTYQEKGMHYDYEIELLIKEITVSPEQMTHEKTVETKEVDDGWRYVLDNNGNVMKDSLGNDIKEKKQKTLKAFVTLTDMHKSARVIAVLDYYDNHSGQLLKTVPLSSEFVFEHHFATFEGDRGALSKKSLELLKHGALPFPTDAQIIFDTSSNLKQKAYNTVRRDKKMFLR